MEKFEISGEVLNKIMAVLGNLTYVQVAKLIEDIKADVKPIDADEDKKD